MKYKLITILLLLFSSISFSQTDSLRINHVETKNKELENQLNQVRQNQLNYKIEKDLLKETYSTNHERIQSIITLILGVFSVLGFLGIRSIWNLKKSYESELNELQKLKLKLENDYGNLVTKQEKLDDKIDVIDLVNKAQENKLRILEIREKADSFIDNEQYVSALEYITIGLEIEPNNDNLKQTKAFVLFKLRKYKEAIKVHNEILQSDPKNIESIYDLAELLLITKDNIRFTELRDKYKSELELDVTEPKTVFLNSVFNYNNNDIESLEKNIKTILDNLDDDEQKEHFNWDFSDLKYAIKDHKDSPIKKHLLNLINLLNGNWSKKKYLQYKNKK